jgi:hypothetical protein
MKAGIRFGNKKKLLRIVLFLPILPVWAQTGTDAGLQEEAFSRLEVSGSVEWDKGELNAAVSLNMAQVGIGLPAGRLRGEEILEDEYPWLLRPRILSLQADSSSTVEDLIRKGEFSLEQLDGIIREALKIPPSLDPDLARLTGRYTIGLGQISAALARHRQAREPSRPLIPSPATDYTGIIIIADTDLPVQGRNVSALARPCLFPRLWDTAMNLIYERTMTDPVISGQRPMVRYTSAENIFRATPSGIDESLIPLVGQSPLRILARGVFGVSPTDLIIDRENALTILSTENNRQLLREGRVIFVLNGAVLRNTLD